VVEKAVEKGLNMIFITDHNTMANVEAAMKAAKKFDNFMVCPGMEITSREEVHVLALFENLTDARNIQLVINEFLPDAYFEKEKQEQIIANEFDEVEGYYGKSLFSAVDIGIELLIKLIHKHHGLAIAAHIDRQSFSIISQLGNIPDDCEFDALEISPNMHYEEAISIYEDYTRKYRFVKGSDSHSLNTIGNAYTKYYSEKNDFESFYKHINEYTKAHYE
jgi:predicted metal-dependent phosphoesterase TrpH